MQSLTSRSAVHILGSLLLGLVANLSCQPPSSEYREVGRNPEFLHASLQNMTEVMIHDIFSPPKASRAYVYPSIAAYEALVPGHPAQRSLAGQINSLAPVPQPNASKEHYLPLSSIHAFLTVAEDVVYSADRMRTYHDDLLADYRAMGIPQAVFERSVAYGDAVAQHILAWAAEDGYATLRSAPKYTVTDEQGRWQPTPPAYMDGVDPNWNMLRPFALDSASQFMPARPHPYSLEESSPFFQQVKEVYEAGQNLSHEQREIAAFWDCNPYVIHTRGHAMFSTKQITPGGHWLGIAAIATRGAEGDLMRTVETYARVAIAVADGFISAFDEKYRSALIRPETVINAHLDQAWQPVLQTPPFPEYTSAHSVISAAAATVLSDLYGESYPFRDTSEVRYGLPERSFDSFQQAAEEAAISRLYGGIHYPMAAERGLDQGRQVGRHVINRIRTRRDQPSSVATLD